MDRVVGSTVLDMGTATESKTIEVDRLEFGKRYQVFGHTDRD
jgi:hypothetical protein